MLHLFEYIGVLFNLDVVSEVKFSHIPLLSILAQWSTRSIAGGSSHTNILLMGYDICQNSPGAGRLSGYNLEVRSIFPLRLVVRSQDTSDCSCFWHSWLQILLSSRSRRKSRTTVLRCQRSGGQARRYSHSTSRRSLRREYLASLITLNWMMPHCMPIECLVENYLVVPGILMFLKCQ